MLNNFQKYIQKHKIVNAQKPTLIAVSGGIDSVVLCHLFEKSELPFAIAHCNFKLRGAESDEDEVFVQTLAHSLDVQYYKIAFDTKNISTKEKSSIQLTARKLRYEWFQEIMTKQTYGQLATAHHMNDRIETFLYNFTKGTGIRGLRNMTAKSGNIVHPLLFASKADIIHYAQKHKLKFRDDASNTETKYSRNKIRIEAIPVLQSINPSLEKTSLDTFKNLEDTEALFQWAIEQHRATLLTEKDGYFYIDFDKLKKTVAPQAILFEFIRPLGFTSEQVKNILDEKTRASGARFVTSNYRLFTNRDLLVITKRELLESVTDIINEADQLIPFQNYNLKITRTTTLPKEYSTIKNTAWFDADKLQFPLTIRRWEAGDFFQPIGMKGQQQKLKKYLTNERLSINEKDNVFVLLSGDDICWVIGRRMDERFKIGAETERGICMEVGT